MKSGMNLLSTLDRRIEKVIRKISASLSNKRSAVNNEEDMAQSLWLKYISLKGSKWKTKRLEDKFLLMSRSLWNYARDLVRRQIKEIRHEPSTIRFSEISILESASHEHPNEVVDIVASPRHYHTLARRVLTESYMESFFKSCEKHLTRPEQEVFRKLTGQDEHFRALLANLSKSTGWGLSDKQILPLLAYACQQPVNKLSNRIKTMGDILRKKLNAS